MQTSFGWMALNAALIGRFYNLISVFLSRFVWCSAQGRFWIIERGKWDWDLNWRDWYHAAQFWPEKRVLEEVVPQEQSSMLCYSAIKCSVCSCSTNKHWQRAQNEGHAWPVQEMWPRLPRNRSLDSLTSLDLSVCGAWQVVPVARHCDLTRLLMSDQKFVYLFNQTAAVSVFKSSNGSNSGPGGTGNEHSLWVYLNTLFIITICVFDPQFKSWLNLYMMLHVYEGKKIIIYSLQMLNNPFQDAHQED